MKKILQNKLTYTTILSVAFIVGCSSKFRNETRILEAILNDAEVNLCNNKCVYVLYSDKGCGACVKLTRNFVLENIANKSAINCIVTGVTDKEIAISFSPKIRAQSNFIHDRQSVGLNLVALYPRVFFIENKEIINSIEINYGNYEYTFNVIRKFIFE